MLAVNYSLMQKNIDKGQRSDIAFRGLNIANSKIVNNLRHEVPKVLPTILIAKGTLVEALQKIDLDTASTHCLAIGIAGAIGKIGGDLFRVGVAKFRCNKLVKSLKKTEKLDLLDDIVLKSEDKAEKIKLLKESKTRYSSWNMFSPHRIIDKTIKKIENM